MKKSLIISVVINILFILSGVYVIHKNGGVDYLKRKLNINMTDIGNSEIKDTVRIFESVPHDTGNINLSVKSSFPDRYLDDIKNQLRKEWPNNRTVNLVFHGHSVPAGYFKTPIVNTFESYPYQLLKELKDRYPYAVINIINTSIGGENSISGEKRFESEVIIHKPDVLFIDYALNDGDLNKSSEAWEKMIKRALQSDIKIILLTPSPDQRIPILEPNNALEKHAVQIRGLAKKYGIGLVDSYDKFRQISVSGDSISNYMSQVNHPNVKGNRLIADEIMKYFY